MNPSVAVITPWKDHGELADAYFTAIRAAKPDRVIILDNGSNPPLEFATIRSEENRGFNSACNAGLECADTDAVLFLNNDIELVRDTWLEEIRAELAPGRLVGELRSDWHTTVDGELHPYLDGWCLAGMRDDLISIGGWDETLEEPAYYGDNLLSLQARQAGMELVDIKVGLRHLGSVTSRAGDWGAVQEVTMRNRSRYKAAVREANRPVAGGIRT